MYNHRSQTNPWNLKNMSIEFNTRICLLRHRGSYMSAHVILNLLNELRKLGKAIKCEVC